jgi:hypothetical protein
MAEYVWDNPKTGFCALRCDKMYIHFFGGETTVNVIIYHVTLELFLMPLLLDNKQTNILFQHGRTSHIHMEVTTFSRRQMPTDGSARIIYYLVFMISRSDPLNLIAQDSVKDEVYVPPMPVTPNTT